MELKQLFKRRVELIEESCQLPVGTEEWDLCQTELEEIEKYITLELEESLTREIEELDYGLDQRLK